MGVNGGNSIVDKNSVVFCGDYGGVASRISGAMATNG